jgi:hypothetical protein
MVQHTQPCKECPFRRASAAEYLGGNSPQQFVVNEPRRKKINESMATMAEAFAEAGL